MNKNYP